MILHTYRCIGRVKEKETLSIFNTYQEKRRKNTKVGTYVLVETFWLINRDNYNGVHAHLRLAMNNQQQNSTKGGEGGVFLYFDSKRGARHA